MNEISERPSLLPNNIMINLFLLNRYLLVVGLVLPILGFARQVHANTFIVTSTEDIDGSTCGANCTLRQAMNAANAREGHDDIVFDSVVFARKQIITLARDPHVDHGQNDLPIMNDSLSIVGPTMPGSGITIQCEKVDAAFRANAHGGQTSLANLTVKGAGTALLVSGGNVIITNCTFANNRIVIYNVSFQHGTELTEEQKKEDPENYFAVLDEVSTVIANNCTLSGNEYAAYSMKGPMTFNSCTITGNRVGIHANDALVLSNCLVAGNSGWNVHTSVRAKSLLAADEHNITSGSAAIIGLDTRGLWDNGGPTPTIALMGRGTAIGTGRTTLLTDQRGLPRSQATSNDVGAYQSQPRSSGSSS